MPGMLAAYVWHWWIGVILLVVSIAAILGLVGQYLQKVSSTRYPKRHQREQ